jgi:hypothetical protein
MGEGAAFCKSPFCKLHFFLQIMQSLIEIRQDIRLLPSCPADVLKDVPQVVIQAPGIYNVPRL